MLDVESELHDKARQAVHAAEEIAAGEEFTSENVKVLRPGELGTGLHPKFYNELLGKIAARDIQRGAGLQWGDVENYDS